MALPVYYMAQVEMARQAGIPQITVSRLLSGAQAVSWRAAVKLGAVLHIAPEVFMYRDRAKIDRAVWLGQHRSRDDPVTWAELTTPTKKGA